MKIDILKKTNIFHYFPSKNLKYSQIFLSETIHAQENGSRGPHFAKSLNSNFLKGLTYSAVCTEEISPRGDSLLLLTLAGFPAHLEIETKYFGYF